MLVAITFYSDSPAADISLIKKYLTLLLIIVVIDWRTDTIRMRNPFISLLFYGMIVLVIADGFTVFKYPNGLMRNEFGTREWLFGNKNNRMYWYVIPVLLAAWRSRYMKPLHGVAVVSLICLFTEIVILKCDSATSAGAFFFVFVGCLVFSLSGNLRLPKVEAFIPVAVFCCG